MIRHGPLRSTTPKRATARSSPAGRSDCESSRAGQAWLKNVNGGWFNTDGLWWDALKEPGGLFNFVGWADGSSAGPTRGCLIVYPAAWMAVRHAPAPRNAPTPGKELPSVGHVGIITGSSDNGRPARVIHCSAGNAAKGDAIAETSPAVFVAHPAALVASCTLITG